MPKQLSPEQASIMIQTSELVKGTESKPKIALTPEGRVIKVAYWRSRLLSSSWFYPYHARFLKRSRKLNQMGILTPQIINIYQCPGLQCDILLYPQINGQSLLDCFDDSHLPLLARFINELHDAGVFFWDLHLGNIVISDQDRLGLLDVATARISQRPLSLKRRARNIGRFICIEYASGNLIKKQIKLFIQHYCRALKWPHVKRQLFLKQLTDDLKKRKQQQLSKEIFDVTL
jgi:tRNA A-37 threonylcarbamoyl transferase component Bud32